MELWISIIPWLGSLLFTVIQNSMLGISKGSWSCRSAKSTMVDRDMAVSVGMLPKSTQIYIWSCFNMFKSSKSMMFHGKLRSSRYGGAPPSPNLLGAHYSCWKLEGTFLGLWPAFPTSDQPTRFQQGVKKQQTIGGIERAIDSANITGMVAINGDPWQCHVGSHQASFAMGHVATDPATASHGISLCEIMSA